MPRNVGINSNATYVAMKSQVIDPFHSAAAAAVAVAAVAVSLGHRSVPRQTFQLMITSVFDLTIATQYQPS